MDTHDPTIAPVPTDLEGVRQYIAALRADFDSHNHDGGNSKTFRTMRADTMTSRAIAMRKISFDDTSAGLWLGLVNDTVKLNIGNATSYLQWDGTSINISGTITGSTIIGGSFKTAASGQRIEILAADNKIHFYDSSAEVVTIGTTSLYAITVVPNSVTNNGISITSAVAGNAMNISNSGSVNARAMLISLSSNSNSLSAIDLTYGGTANGIIITANAAGSTGIFCNVTNSSGGYAMLAQSISAVNPAVYISNSGSTCLYVTGGSSSSTIAVVGGSPTGNTGVINISATNEGDCISLTQAASSSNAAIGIHINVTNSGHTTKAYALRFEGDLVVSSAVGGSQDKKIRVLVGATDYYIPVYTA